MEVVDLTVTTDGIVDDEEEEGEEEDEEAE